MSALSRAPPTMRNSSWVTTGSPNCSTTERGSTRAPVKPVSTTHSTSSSPAGPPTRLPGTTGSGASLTLPAMEAIPANRVRRVVAHAGEVEVAFGHRVVRGPDRLGAGVAEEVATRVGLDGDVAPRVVGL